MAESSSEICKYVPDEEEKPVDLLDRDEIVEKIVRLLTIISNNSGSATFALNGAWGTGKTFVLNKLEEALLMQQAGEKFVVFRYNCWKYDYYDEPLVAIVAAMLDSVDTENHLLSRKARTTLQSMFEFCRPNLEKIASEISKNKLGIDLVEILSKLKQSKDSYDECKNEIEKKYHESDPNYSFNKTLKNVREELRNISKERTLVVVVDELDRCQPNYAIKVLERLHHLFAELENCVVVLAIDKSQLNKTVEQVFGENISVDAYLKKFIDFELTLDAGTINGEFIAKYPEYFSMFDRDAIPTEFSYEKYLTALFDGIEIRTQEHLMERITIIHRMLFSDESKDYSFMCFELMMLVLLDYHDQYEDALFIPMDDFVFSGKFRLKIERDKTLKFCSYIEDGWKVKKQDSYSNGIQERIEFGSPIDIPQLLIWYLGTLKKQNRPHYLIGFVENKAIYEKNVEEFKSVYELLKIIR